MSIRKGDWVESISDESEDIPIGGFFKVDKADFSLWFEDEAGERRCRDSNRYVVRDIDKELEAAEKRVETIKAAIKREAAKIKVGDKFKHGGGNSYVIAKIGGSYALVCYESPDNNSCGVCYCGARTEIDGVFSDFRGKFTKID